MKKSFIIGIAALFIASASVFAQTEADFEFRNGTITGYKGTSKDVVIPAEINGIPVTSIEEGAFYKKELTSVIIPDSVTSIGSYAFCTNKLTSVIIPDSVTSIGSYTFCTNKLISVTLPDTVEIASSAFSENPIDGFLVGYLKAGKKAGTYDQPVATEDDFDVEQLANNTLKITGYKGSIKDITIPSELWGLKVTSIGRSAFAREHLTSVIIPDTVTEIGEHAFNDNDLANVTLGKGIVKINTGAFSVNKKLESIVLPDSLVEIGEQAFSSCGLTSITWGKKIATLRANAFSHNKLTELTIPGTIITIPPRCFEWNQIESLILSNGITLIESYAFGLNPITTLVIPASLATADRNSLGIIVPRIQDSFGSQLTRVTLPANMVEGNLNGGKVPETLFNFWISQNKAGGTYIKRGPIWSKE
jgi:hypothetical protein